MTVVNPKSISGINSITMASGSDNLLTIHTTNTTERVRVNSDGDVIVGSGITVSPDGDIFATGVTTSTTFVGALTGNVTGNISGGTVAGSTGSFSDNLDVTGSIRHTGDTDTKINFETNIIHFDTDNAERLRIDSSGNVNVQTGNLVIGTAGKGIDFSAQTATSASGASATSEILDHYEEGSWTPDLRFGNATTGITYATDDPRGGKYVRIGRQVTLNYSLSLSSKGSASGDAKIFGIPFAVAADFTGVNTQASGVVGYFNNIENSSLVMNMAEDSNDSLRLRHTVGAEDDPDSMNDTHFTDNSDVRGSITYFTD